MENKYSVYLLLCKDGSYYCGIAIDVLKRLEAHNLGQGAKYTRGKTKRPAAVLAAVDGFTRSEALKAEYHIKQSPKLQKVANLLTFECLPFEVALEQIKKPAKRRKAKTR